MKLAMPLFSSPVLNKDTSFDQCIKCTVCTVYCPVAKANPQYAGPKQCGPDGERLRLKSPDFYDEMLKLCTNCKRCETACPSGVRIGDIIAVARGEYDKKPVSLTTVRDYVLSNTDLFGSISTPFAPVVNAITQVPLVKKAMHKTIKVHDHKTLPKYSHGTFRRWYKKQAQAQQQYARRIGYFHGCYVNYNHPQLGKEFIKVMNAINYGVELLDKEKCCGVPLIANGFHKKAKQNAEFNLGYLEQALANKAEAIVSTSSTCCFALQEEYPHVLGVDNHKVVEQIHFFSRFLLGEFINGNLPKMEPLNKTIVYHTPCHLERSGDYVFTIELLKMIPGLKVQVLDSECCGLAGTYGFKSENYATSMAIGEGLFAKINASNADYVVSDCETCKWQIEENTQLECLHPISLIAKALA